MLASTAFDALARLGVDDEGLSKAGHYTLIFGLVGAADAAATGVVPVLRSFRRLRGVDG